MLEYPPWTWETPHPTSSCPIRTATPSSCPTTAARRWCSTSIPRPTRPVAPPRRAAIRDRRADYEAAGAVVLGVSPDPVTRVKRFHDKQSLNFTLLADEDHAVTEQYGAWVEKSMYGKKYWGAQRTTFIVDADGTIAHVIPKASPKTHDDEVLRALEELEAEA